MRDIAGSTMDLHLTNEQVAFLVAELDRIIDGALPTLAVAARDPRAAEAIPRPQAAAPQRLYEPPSKGRYSRQR